MGRTVADLEQEFALTTDDVTPPEPAAIGPKEKPSTSGPEAKQKASPKRRGGG